MSVHIDFEPVGRRGQCPDGQSLLDCARQLGVDLVNLCGGMGSCGRCKVQIVAGRVGEVDRGGLANLVRQGRNRSSQAVVGEVQ